MMKKTPSLFQRNYDTDRLVRDEVTPGTEWVQNGEGLAYQKLDGTCCMIDENQQLWKRREVKNGKPDPIDFLLSEHDEVTGKRVGWVSVDPESKEDRWHMEAYNLRDGDWEPGTYELIGPKIQGNPEHWERHELIEHDAIILAISPPNDFESLKLWLSHTDSEGIVWHHPDGRMVKIKGKDFGIKRPSLSE